MIEKAKSEDDKVRVRAVYALGRIIESSFTKYREEIIQTLVEGLKDLCDWVRGIQPTSLAELIILKRE